jgi:zinc transport system substrate-binding protein
MVTESCDQQIAQTIINNTRAKNQQILVLDAMQSITADDIDRRKTYLSIMSDNLDVLKNATN